MSTDDKTYFQALRDSKLAQSARTPKQLQDALEKLQPPQRDEREQPWVLKLRAAGANL